MRVVQWVVNAFEAVRSRPWLYRTLQAAAIVATIAFCTLAIVSEWGKASGPVENANLIDVGLALAAIAAYYLVFIFGWIRILDAWGIKIGYRVALQAEMVSMLAKYVPGGGVDAGRADRRPPEDGGHHRHGDRCSPRSCSRRSSRRSRA